MFPKATLWLALCAGFAFNAQADSITVSGSTSASHIVEVLAETYSATHKDTTIAVQGIGSSGGITAVQQNAAELGMSSRVLSKDEKESQLKSVTFAHDGIALVVNQDNPVTNLTKEQVSKIYHGEITNWKEVGGPDRVMAVVTRENASGSRFSFEDFMGLTKDIKGMRVSDINPQSLVVNTNGMVKSLVSRNLHAIGYISLGSIDNSIKPLSFEGVEPTLTNLEAGKYQISRPFLMLYKEKTLQTEKSAKSFLDYVISPQGQKIIDERGYLASQINQ
ncbi:phosphate ABC transporter substrate-binding protein [Photobacterium jeanii]|uniref:Phosphate-binding protein n=1 Tax=Photobacterium jeanii TaxID=858640 RepID=A0A178K7Y5_9GAMM|nr:phosphate ABC transporter substrate-binding protein [Photobacterium jeanii]OAN13085.1 phosphate ABC transporter substrate-binding protein [Photobacterium jeanii]PST89234.1 phosphate ABC transporter substrate-binding protein [Photobacterium jeanii]